MQTVHIAKPYKAESRGGYWYAIDTRTGQPASYPSGPRAARDATDTLNRAYAEAVAETQAA